MELGVASLLLVMLSEGPAFGLELIERARAPVVRRGPTQGRRRRRK
jgi:hypothetical protein